MDFFVTVSSDPSSNLPENSISYAKYFLEKANEFDGQYEVALVQSVFKGFWSPRLATLKIYTNFKTNDEFNFYFEAEDGESYESVINEVNTNLSLSFQPYTYRKFKTHKIGTVVENSETLEYDDIPNIKFDRNNNEFKINLPKDWKFDLLIEDKNQIKLTENDKIYLFQGSHFFLNRHFYVLSNLIDKQLTGDESFQILSNFVFDKIYSNVALKEFEYPQYIKLSKNFKSEFSLEYRQDLNRSLFSKGTIISTLHFRKINGF